MHLVFLAVLVIEVDMGLADKAGYGPNPCGVCVQLQYVMQAVIMHASYHPSLAQCPTFMKNVWTRPWQVN